MFTASLRSCALTEIPEQAEGQPTAHSGIRGAHKPVAERLDCPGNAHHARQLRFLFEPATSTNFEQMVAMRKDIALPVPDEVPFIQIAKASSGREVKFKFETLSAFVRIHQDQDTQARDSEKDLGDLRTLCRRIEIAYGRGV